MTLLVQNLLMNDEFYSLSVDVSVTVEVLKCMLEIEAKIPPSEQVIYYKNREIKVNT